MILDFRPAWWVDEEVAIRDTEYWELLIDSQYLIRLARWPCIYFRNFGIVRDVLWTEQDYKLKQLLNDICESYDKERFQREIDFYSKYDFM